MDSDGPQFIWGAYDLARFWNVVDEQGKPDIASFYYRHKHKQFAGVINVGRSLVGHVPTMLGQFNTKETV
jgi:hypothetical protein